MPDQQFKVGDRVRVVTENTSDIVMKHRALVTGEEHTVSNANYQGAVAWIWVEEEGPYRDNRFVLADTVGPLAPAADLTTTVPATHPVPTVVERPNVLTLGSLSGHLIIRFDSLDGVTAGQEVEIGDIPLPVSINHDHIRTWVRDSFAAAETAATS